MAGHSYKNYSICYALCVRKMTVDYSLNMHAPRSTGIHTLKAQMKRNRCACDDANELTKVHIISLLPSAYLLTTNVPTREKIWFARTDDRDDDDGPLLSVGIDAVTHKLFLLFAGYWFLYAPQEKGMHGERSEKLKMTCTQYRTLNTGESVIANAAKNHFHFILSLMNMMPACFIPFRSRRRLHNRWVPILRALTHQTNRWWIESGRRQCNSEKMRAKTTKK